MRAENFPSESLQMKNEKTQKNTGERGEEEILSLSSQRERRKSNKWFRLYSEKCTKENTAVDLKTKGTVALVSVLRACHARNHLH